MSKGFSQNHVIKAKIDGKNYYKYKRVAKEKKNKDTGLYFLGRIGRTDNVGQELMNCLLGNFDLKKASDIVKGAKNIMDVVNKLPRKHRAKMERRLKNCMATKKADKKV